MHQVGKLTIRVQIPSALELPGYKGKPSIINACKLPAEKYFSQDKNGSRGCFNEGVFKKSYGLKTWEKLKFELTFKMRFETHCYPWS